VKSGFWIISITTALKGFLFKSTLTNSPFCKEELKLYESRFSGELKRDKLK